MFLRKISNTPFLKSNQKMIYSIRSLSLDFQPIPEFEDPLDGSARSAFAKSCYLKINWKINENLPVAEAINRMVANKIGALAVFNDHGEISGMISERDIIKIAYLGKTSKTTKISEICTNGQANLVSVSLDNPIDACMRKMINCNVRHLLVREKGTGAMVGMISVKDIVKCSLDKHEAVVNKLTEMVVISEAMRNDA